MVTVELVYDRDCPNVSGARENLLRAFATANISASWVEWDRSDPASPPHARGYGSPAVLVGGVDVAGAQPSDGASCCRVYTSSSGGLGGVPPVEAITAALQAAGERAKAEETPPKAGRQNAGWRSSLAVLPGIGATLLPVGLCPACWPVYAGLLSALGLGFLSKTVYLLPATSVFLLFAVGALAYRATSRRGYGPFAVGLAASVIILLGKFVFVSDAAMYGGIVLLLVASVWNAWPSGTSERNDGAWPACAPEGHAPHSQ